MAPRWGWGRKLIGTDAKTSAEIANHPQNHPPRLRISPPNSFTSGTEHSSPLASWLPPRSAWPFPRPSRRRWTRSRRLCAFRSRAGRDGASPPAWVLLSNAHLVPRRPPALMIPQWLLILAEHPVSGYAAGSRWCLLSKAGCGSACAAPWVCTPQEHGSGQGAGLAASRCLHTSDPRVTYSVVVHPLGMTPMQHHSFGSPGGGPAAGITTSHPSVSGPFSCVHLLFCRWWCPSL